MNTTTTKSRLIIEFVSEIVTLCVAMWWFIEASTSSERLLFVFLMIAVVISGYATAKNLGLITPLSFPVERRIKLGLGMGLVLFSLGLYMTQSVGFLFFGWLVVSGFALTYVAWKQTKPRPVQESPYAGNPVLNINQWTQFEPDQLKKYTALLLLGNLALGCLAWFMFGATLAQFILGIGGLLVILGTILLGREQRKANVLAKSVTLLALLTVFLIAAILIVGVAALLINTALS